MSQLEKIVSSVSLPSAPPPPLPPELPPPLPTELPPDLPSAASGASREGSVLESGPGEDHHAVVAGSSVEAARFSARLNNVNVAAIDRSEWEAVALRQHPEILELRERLRPLSRAETFGRIYNAGKTEVKYALTGDIIHQLILQHFASEGNHECVRHLEADLGIHYLEVPGIEDSRLRTLLRIAIKEVDKVFDMTIADKPTDNDPEVEFLDHLGSLDLVGDTEVEKSSEGDKNIWDEGEDSTKNIVVKSVENDPGMEMIVAGTLNKLIERLTSHEARTARFRDTFLLTYRSFTTPEKLLEKLIQRYDVPALAGAKNTFAIQARVVDVVRHWVETSFFDFNDNLITKLTGFIRLIEERHEQLGRSIRTSLQKKLDGRGSSSGFLFEEKIFSENPPDPIVPKTIFNPKMLQLVHIDELEVARQLTIQTWKIFARIRPVELQNQAWSKAKHRAPNVVNMTALFNNFARHVSLHILSCEKLRDRVKIMTRYIEIAKHLQALNNYHMLMGVVAGFQNAAVSRLKFTREELSKKSSEQLGNILDLMTSENNFNNYRTVLREFPSPCIPFLGVFLTDLTFIEEGNSNFQGNLINFFKRQLVGNSIKQIQQFQQAAYNLQEVYQIQLLLKNLKVADDAELFNMSKDREPKGADKNSLK